MDLEFPQGGLDAISKKLNQTQKLQFFVVSLSVSFLPCCGQPMLFKKNLGLDGQKWML